MFTLYNIQELLNLMSCLIAYLLIISPPGAFNAWVAKKMGDSTASEMGLESLNPLAHVDPVGLICLILFRIGWGQDIPVNSNAINGKYRTAKLIAANFAGIPIYLVQSTIYIFSLAIIFGGTDNISTNLQVSSLALVTRDILEYGALLSILLAVIKFIFKGVMLLVTALTEKNYIDPKRVWYILIFASIAALFILGQPLQIILRIFIYKIADNIALCFGII